jgi:hypothetical protein
VPNPEKPTPAQRRVLLEAIETGRPVKLKAGASASRMRRTMLANGWIESGHPTPAAHEALGVTCPRPTDVVHAIADGSATTSCCGRTPFELPRASHRLTQDSDQVTCQGRMESAPNPPAAGDA